VPWQGYTPGDSRGGAAVPGWRYPQHLEGDGLYADQFCVHIDDMVDMVDMVSMFDILLWIFRKHDDPTCCVDAERTSGWMLTADQQAWFWHSSNTYAAAC
jgi:hypothetical protein